MAVTVTLGLVCGSVLEMGIYRAGTWRGGVR